MSSGTMTVRDQYETSRRLKYDQRGRSMISTGMAGMPAQSYSPKSASRNLGKDVGLDRPALGEDQGASPRHRRVVRRHAGHLHGEVGLDGGGEVVRAPLVEAPAAVRKLALAEVRDDLRFALAVDAVEDMTEEEVLARDGTVGLQLADPMPVRLLGPEEEPVRALDGGVDAGRCRVRRSGRRGVGHTHRAAFLGKHRTILAQPVFGAPRRALSGHLLRVSARGHFLHAKGIA
jgi:hypothetical protein